MILKKKEEKLNITFHNPNTTTSTGKDPVQELLIKICAEIAVVKVNKALLSLKEEYEQNKEGEEQAS